MSQKNAGKWCIAVRMRLPIFMVGTGAIASWGIALFTR